MIRLGLAGQVEQVIDHQVAVNGANGAPTS